MTHLARTQFGNPVLRRVCRSLSPAEITSAEIQTLLNDMKSTLIDNKLGIGLAAPQVGKPIGVAVIAIRPTAHRPRVKPFDLVLINPVITKPQGEKYEMWEGCISAGSNGTADLFAKVPRYKQITVQYLDEHGKSHTKSFAGLKAQVVQHEVDHLNGILFVDHVTNPKTYMTYSEYMNRIRKVQSL